MSLGKEINPSNNTKQDNIPSDLEFYYSSYNYIKVSKSEYSSDSPVINYYKDDLLSGKINKLELKNTININLKTFYGDCMKYKLNVPINETISEIIYRLISSEANLENIKQKWEINKQFRIISSLSGIRELNIYNNYIEENIQENETLIILNIENYYFSNTLKASQIYLFDEKTSAVKMDCDIPKYCFVEPGFKFGKKYIEFLLESEPLNQNIMIGLSTYRTDFSFDKSMGFFGFIPGEKKLIKNINGNLSYKNNYGFKAKIGDKIGMLIDFSKERREVAFYIDKIPIGIGFTDLPKDILYPCLVLGYAGTKISLLKSLYLPEEDSEIPEEFDNFSEDKKNNIENDKNNNNNKNIDKNNDKNNENNN